MTDPGHLEQRADYECLGPGLRGLRPGPGDQVLVDDTVVPWLVGLHWLRVLQVPDPYAAPLRLVGYLLPREDRGEKGITDPLVVTIADPAELVVRRPAGAVPLEVATPASAVPGPVGQLLAGQPERRDLPAAVLDALERPDQHRRGETGVPRWPE